MAEIAHLAWYRQGTVSVSDGSTKVTGSGTKFLTAGINQGAAFRIDSRPYAWEIKRVVSDTELELAAPYYGGTISNASYSIDRNHQSTLPADLSARLAKAMGNWEERYDTDMRTITGPSAYDVAVANGFTGTEAQWVESLKAAQEWTTLNNRTEILTYNNAAAHNAFNRGKNLGTAITASQIAAIRDGTFADLYPGDYWTITSYGTIRILGFNIMRVGDTLQGARRKHAAVVSEVGCGRRINATATCEGHILNSELYTERFPTYLTALEAAIGADNIVPFYDEVADSIDDSGNVNHRTTVEACKLFLPSYMNITGNNAIMGNMGWRIAGQVQFPYYRHNNGHFSGRIAENCGTKNWHYIWNFARVLQDSSANNEAFVGETISPCFLIG